MKKIAMIEVGIVKNLIMIEDGANWAPNQVCELVDVTEIANVSMGSSYHQGVFSAPTPNVEERVFSSITQRQFRLWLLSLGLTEDVILSSINQIEDPQEKQKALIEFTYASEYLRNHPLVSQVGALLGLSEAQLDDGFEAAASL